jgi:hypothetical protein
MASEAEERSQLLLERPRLLAVQNRSTKVLAAVAGRAARLALMCHWQPAGQDRLECRWTIESLAGTGALRAVGDNDQTTSDTRTNSFRARGPATQERLRGDGRVVDFAPKHDRKIEDELYRRLRRQDALVFAIGLLLLVVAAAATYLYWDYARPFIATDDPQQRHTRCADKQDGRAAFGAERGPGPGGTAEVPRRQNRRAGGARTAPQRIAASNAASLRGRAADRIAASTRRSRWASFDLR